MPYLYKASLYNLIFLNYIKLIRKFIINKKYIKFILIIIKTKLKTIALSLFNITLLLLTYTIY